MSDEELLKGWIPVSEKLPVDFEVVDFYDSVCRGVVRGYHTILKYSSMPQWRMADADPCYRGKNYADVTHWKPVEVETEVLDCMYCHETFPINEMFSDVACCWEHHQSLMAESNKSDMSALEARNAKLVALIEDLVDEGSNLADLLSMHRGKDWWGFANWNNLAEKWEAMK